MNSSNIRFEYLYRDAGNFKNWGEVIFSNELGTPSSKLTEELRGVLLDGAYFIADRAKVYDLHFADYDSDLDHGWHEFHACCETLSPPTDSLNRDIETFLVDLKRVNQKIRSRTF